MFAKALITFCVIAVASSLSTLLEGDDARRIDFAEIERIVNVEGSTWRAKANPLRQNSTHAELKRALGTILPGDRDYIAPEHFRTEYLYDVAAPASFDVRTAWPNCAPITGHVRDQSSCGSCWAFSATESFNDRYCIKTGDAKTLFSPQDTAACCSGLSCSMSMGCNGGQPSGAWNWFTKTGVVSGGDYADVNTGDSCTPYSLQSCSHHTEPVPAGMVDCSTLPEYPTPKCYPSSCTDKSYAPGFDKHLAKSSYGVKGVNNMMTELQEKGTLSVAFTVYEDFEAYDGGVYVHKTGKSLGGHAVVMVGWGEDNGTPYWTCKNSWGPTWAEGGFFRILRGQDECGIESSVVAGDA